MSLLTKINKCDRIMLGDNMDKEEYKLETYTILSVTTYRLLEKETGEYWYPITLFFSKILFRKTTAGVFRDNEMYRKHMRVIEYENPDNSFKNKKMKTWFIDTEGMCLILINTKLKKDTPKKMLVRQKYLAAAQNFFGVTSNNSQEFIGYQPDLSNYDVWSIMCLTRDYNLKKDTLWKRCGKCGFYYPHNKDYFIERNGYLANNCRQCTGNDFVCKNRKIQFLYNHDGLDLIYQYYLGDKDKIAEEFNKWIG